MDKINPMTKQRNAEAVLHGRRMRGTSPSMVPLEEFAREALRHQGGRLWKCPSLQMFD